MNETRRSNKMSKPSNKYTVLLGIMMLAVLAGLATAAYTTGGNRSEKILPPEKGVFNPFTLKTIIVADNGLNLDAIGSVLPARTLVSRPLLQGPPESNSRRGQGPPIIIPPRPDVRTPFRPPWPPPPWR